MPNAVCQALIFCEQNIVDPKTGKHTLEGVLEGLSAPHLPLVSGPFCVHVIVDDFVYPNAPASLVLNIKFPESTSIVAAAEIKFKPDAAKSMQPFTLPARFAFDKVAFPGAGNYTAELVWNQRLLISRLLEIRSNQRKAAAPNLPPLPAGNTPPAISGPKNPASTSPETRQVVAYVQQGSAQQGKGAYAAAIAAYTEAVRMDPKCWIAFANMGLCHRLQGQLDKATVNYEEAIRVAPAESGPYVFRGYAFQETGRPSEAIADFDIAQRYDPKNLFIYFGRALAYQALDEKEKAIADYNEVLVIEPKNTHALNNRGTLHQRMGNSDAALADYNEATRIDPKFGDPYMNRGRLFGLQKKFAAALPELEKGLAISPKNPDLWSFLGMTAVYAGNMDKAIASYNEAIRQGHRDAGTYLLRGFCLRATGQLRPALADFDESIRLDPTKAEAFSRRGDAHRALSQLDLAMTDLNEAIRLNPQHAEAFYTRGLVKHLQGDFDGGIADYDEAIRINPNYSHAIRMRQIALELRESGSDTAIPIKPSPEVTEAENEAVNAALGERDESDPLARLKPGADEITRLLRATLQSEGTFPVESLLIALGSVGGFACQMSVREGIIKKGHCTENAAFIISQGKDGRRYFFGDALNKPLAEDRYSLWNLCASAAQQLGAQAPDVMEIFRHVTSTVGGEKFGIPRVPESYSPEGLPIHWLKYFWPKLLPTITEFCDKPADWPIVLGLAIQETVLASKDSVDPAMAAAIVMECAIPMSKVDLPEFYLPS